MASRRWHHIPRSPLQLLLNAGIVSAGIVSAGIIGASSGWALAFLEPAAAQLSRPDRPGSTEVALANTAFAEGDRPLLQFGSEGPLVEALQAMLQLMGYYAGPIDGQFQQSTLLAVSGFQQSAGLTEDGIVGPTTWTKLLPALDQVQPPVVIPPPQGSESDPPAAPPVAETRPAAPEDSASSPPASSEPTATTDQGDRSAAASESSATAPTENVSLPILRVGMRGSAVTRMQERLRRLGFYQGVVDGIFGPQTEDAVQAFQRSASLNPDGIVGPVTWTALLE